MLLLVLRKCVLSIVTSILCSFFGSLSKIQKEVGVWLASRISPLDGLLSGSLTHSLLWRYIFPTHKRCGVCWVFFSDENDFGVAFTVHIKCLLMSAAQLAKTPQTSSMESGMISEKA